MHFCDWKLRLLEPDTETRQFYCIVGLLAGWNASISSWIPDPWSSRLLKGQRMTSKGNTARGASHTRTNTYFSLWRLLWYHLGRHPDTELVNRKPSSGSAKWCQVWIRSANKLFTWNEKLRALHLAAGTWPANSHMQLKVHSFVLLIKDSLKVLKGRCTLMNAVLRFVTAESSRSYYKVSVDCAV